MHHVILERRSRIARPIQELFAFFAEARNLERITPPWLRFEVLTPAPIHMHAGALIDYRLRWRGVPIRWRTEITAWEPPVFFLDRQLRGPYRLWEHEHRFTADGDGTVMLDRVRYAAPGGRLVQQLIVGRDVASIFDFRRRRIHEIFPTLDTDSGENHELIATS